MSSHLPHNKLLLWELPSWHFLQNKLFLWERSQSALELMSLNLGGGSSGRKEKWRKRRRRNKKSKKRRTSGETGGGGIREARRGVRRGARRGGRGRRGGGIGGERGRGTGQRRKETFQKCQGCDNNIYNNICGNLKSSSANSSIFFHNLHTQKKLLFSLSNLPWRHHDGH